MTQSESRKVFAAKSFRTALALGIGAMGGLIAVLLNVPLALLLGPLLVTMLAGLAGAPVLVPNALRTTIMTVLGAFLASKFTPDIAQNMSRWPVSLAMVPVFILVSTAVAGFYFHRIAGLDKVSAIFAAVPGGLVSMIVTGGQFGGDERRIAVSQVLRIVISVFVVTYTLWGLFDIQRDQAGMVMANMDADLTELAIVGLAAALGAVAASWVGLPAPQFFGPLIFVAPLYLTGMVAAAIPGPVLALALWIMGTSVGSRFAGFEARIVARIAGHTLVSVSLLLLVAASIAGLLSVVTGIPFIAGMLAFSPGGLAEMSIIALAMDVDPAYVAVHHLLRIGICIMAAPFIGNMVKADD